MSTLTLANQDLRFVGSSVKDIPDLKILDVHGNSFDSPLSGKQMVEIFEKNILEALNINECFSQYSESKKGLNIMLAGLKNNSSLTELQISGNFVTEAQEIAEALRNTSCSLKFLNLADNCLKDKGAIELADALACNTVLTHLDISRNGIMKDGFKELTHVLTTQTTLEKLNISFNLLVNVGEELYSLLTANSTLKSLNLSCTELSPEDFGAICDALCENTSLEELYVAECHRIKEFELIVKSLRVNNTLKILDLSKNKMTDASATQIFSSLRTNETLKQLDLSNNKIQNIEELVAALAENKTLKTLQLADNKLGIHGVLAVIMSLAHNTSLHILSLARNFDPRSAKFDDHAEAFEKVKELLESNYSLYYLSLYTFYNTDLENTIREVTTRNISTRKKNRFTHTKAILQ